jgi:hypothetical protein
MPVPNAAVIRPYSAAVPCSARRTRNTSATLSIAANATKQTVATTSARGTAAVSE